MPTISDMTVYEGASVIVGARGQDNLVEVAGTVTIRDVSVVDTVVPTWTPNPGGGWTGKWTSADGEDVTDTVDESGFHRHYSYADVTYFTPRDAASFDGVYEAIIASHLADQEKG
jgi:hypothetical protein